MTALRIENPRGACSVWSDSLPGWAASRSRFIRTAHAPDNTQPSPDAQPVEVWHPDDERPEIVTDALRWRAVHDAPEVEIELARLFENLPT